MVDEKDRKEYVHLKDYTQEEIEQLLRISKARNLAELNSYMAVAKTNLSKKQSSENSDRTYATAATAPNADSKLSIEAIQNYFNSSELELDRDLDTKHNPVKPFVLYYDSVLEGDNPNNAENVIKALKDENFKKRYPTAYREGLNIVAILEQQQNGTLTKEQASQKLKILQLNAETPLGEGERTKVSHKTRARLARQLQLAGNCDYRVRVEKLPDMAWLIPVSYCTNLEDYEQYGYGKGKQDNYFDPKWRRNEKKGLFYDPRPKYSTTTDENGLDVRTRLVENLKRRRSELQNISNTSSDVIEFYNLVIDAYSSNDWDKIKKLNSEINTMDRVAAAYDIRHNACFVYPPDNYEQRDIYVKTSSDDIDPPVIDKSLDTYTSDEWNQLLTIASQTAINQANSLSEGLAVTVLKEVLGDKFPQNWQELSLDEQEKVFEEMNPVQTARFNAGVVEKAENLSELLPPHFLTLLAKNTDKAINSASDNEKDILNSHRNTLIKAMASQIEQYNKQTIDSLNAAGVYDGAKEMLDYLSTALETSSLPQNISITQEQINSVDEILERAIEAYDEDNGLNGITQEDADKIEKAYDILTQEVKQISDNNKIAEYLDDETKSILEQLEFTETADEQGNTTSAEENKKLFIENILWTATQHTAVANKEKNDEELKKAFQEQIVKTTLLETASLIGAIEAVDTANGSQRTINAAKTPEEKKNAIKNYLAKYNGKVSVNKDALSGYFAISVNKQSLFTNRLASKLGNRTSAVFKKMWKPFEKIDKTCIQRFGKAYTIPKGIFARSLTNLPWTAGNAVARVAAFSQIGTPWGMACVGAYGAYSVLSTAYRMHRQYKELKKQNATLTAGKFFKHNWSGMLLSAVGTAASIIPGLSSGVEALQSVTDWMKDSGLLSASSLPGAEQLKMTNLSTIMIGAGLADSTIKGTIANRKQGNGFLKSLFLGGSTAVLSSVTNIGVGMACAYGANELWQTGMNLGADTRTVDSSDSNSGLTRDTNIDEVLSKFEGQELAELQKDIGNLQNGNLSEAQYNQTLEEIRITLAEKGLTLETPQNGEQADISIFWKEQEAGYSDITINGRTVTEHADHVAADWQRDVPGLHEKNVSTIVENPAIVQFNNENPLMAVDPSRMEMIIMLCGGQAVPADMDTHVNYNQYGENVDVNGNHRCITDGWLEKYGNDPDIIKYCNNEPITADEIAAIRGLHDQDGNFQSENLTPRLLGVINALDHKISANFEVGDLESTRTGAFNNGVLDNITTVNENGEHVHASDGEADRYNTYANAVSARNDTDKSGSSNYIIKQHQEQYHMPHNPSVDLYNFVTRLKEGCLARVMGENVRATKETDATRTTIKSQDVHKPTQSTDTSRDVDGDKVKTSQKQGFFARIFKGRGSNNK